MAARASPASGLARFEALVRVSLADGSTRTLMFDRIDATADDVHAVLVEKLGLPSSLFQLYELRGTSVVDVLAPSRPVSSLPDSGTSSDNRVVLVPRHNVQHAAFLDDSAALAQMYHRCCRQLVDETTAPTVEQVVELGGLRCQVLFGNFEASRHTVAFVTRQLDDFVPRSLLLSSPGVEWEQEILAKFESSSGRSAEIAMRDYVCYAHANVLFMGTLWLEPCLSSLSAHAVQVGVSHAFFSVIAAPATSILASASATSAASASAASASAASPAVAPASRPLLRVPLSSVRDTVATTTTFGLRYAADGTVKLLSLSLPRTVLLLALLGLASA